MPAIPWGAARMGLKVTVNGTEFEGIEYSGTFDINGIPQCSVIVAVGRDVKTGKRAAVHDNFDKVLVRDKIEIMITPERLGESDAKVPHLWKSGLLFEGFVTGIGWQRSTGGAQFRIFAEHWIADFNYSSSLSGGSHPSNPAQYSFGSVFPPRGLTDAGLAQWMPNIPRNVIFKSMLNAGLWDNVLKKWVELVAKEDPLDERLKAPEDSGKGNGLVLNALPRVKSDSMEMDINDGDESWVGDNVADYLSNRSFGQADYNQTMWGKLLEWANDFFFMVIPRPNEVLIVPNGGPLRGKVQATIKTGDYVSCDISMRMGQIVRCVGISHTTEMSAGLDTGPAVPDSPDIKDLAAVYPDPPKKGGIAIVKEAPGWMQDSVLPYRKSRKSVGTPDGKVTGTAFDPKGTGSPMDPPDTPKDNMKAALSILQQMAQSWYNIENISGRSAEISDRLRFDICPGSQVKIESGGDPFIKGDKLVQNYYAMVTRVTTVINSELQRAGTSFSLAFVRTEKENDNDDFTTSKPALYKKGWYGKELVDGYSPDQ